jgi:hypothetical protein
MLREYGKNYDSIWMRLSRPLIIVLALALVVLVMYLVSLFWGMLSEKQEKILDAARAQEEVLLERIAVIVIEAGYITEGTGSETVYIPALRCFVTNRTNTEMKQIFVTSTFKTDERYICQTQIPILYLRANETREVSLRCIEIMGIGTIMKGLTLLQTTNKIIYELSITENDVTAVAITDELKYKNLI